LSYFYARTRPLPQSKQTFSLDDIYTQLNLVHLNLRTVNLRQSHLFADTGMAPVRVVIYDVANKNAHIDARINKIDRRLLIVQGFRPLTDLILDYTPNWETI